MTGKGRAAALVVTGGALLGGCAPQSPATTNAQPVYYLPPPVGYGAATSPSLPFPVIEQPKAVRRYEPEPLAQPAPRPPPRNEPMPVSEAATVPVPVPVTPKKAPVQPKAPVDPDCVGWWRICHFL